MITTIKSVREKTSEDAAWVGASIAGNRDAFGRIVARYQSLICSLAYSATGSLSQSEDLAQETFVTAWKQLGGLREPEKLRSWLCGIARNVIHNKIRREQREPSHQAGSLEEVAETPSLEPQPLDQAISHEEQAILWRSLAKIPELYREPLVLFYREHQSIEAVAKNLDLSEDAVKQRLSRGRKLLHEQVLAFVEGALERTNPGKVFTVGVLAALPAFSFSAKAATLGATAAKGSSTAKWASLAGAFSFIFGNALIFLGNYFGYRMAIASAQSEVERGHINKFYRLTIGWTLALFVPVAGGLTWYFRDEKTHGWMLGLIPALLVIYILVTCFFTMKHARHRRKFYADELQERGVTELPQAAYEYYSRIKFLGLPLAHIRIGDRFSSLRGPVRGWIAVGHCAIGGLFAFGGMAIAPVSIGFCAFGLITWGALAAGLISIGGVSLGVWAFGGLALGWQVVGGCAIAWNTVLGDLVFTPGWTLGNDAVSQSFIQSNWFFRSALAFNRHWFWWNLLWVGPMFIQRRVIEHQRRKENS